MVPRDTDVADGGYDVLEVERTEVVRSLGQDEAWRRRSGEGQGVIGIGLDATDAREAAVALDESRRRLQGLFEHTTDAIFLADDDRRLVDANPAAEELTGWSLAELLDMRIDDLTATDGGADTEAAWRAFLDNGFLEGVWPLRLRAGGSLTVDYRSVAHIIPGLHMAVMRDMTERRAAEEALRRNEERFRALVQNATDGVMITDGELRSIYVSPSMERIVGYSVDELVGTSSFDFIHPDDFGRVATTLGRLFQTRGPTEPERFRVRHRNGTWRWVEAVGTDLRDDPAVGGIVVNVRDVTEQTHVQQALAESEARFRRIAENARDIVFRVRITPEPAMEYFSPAVHAITGYRPEELYANPRALLDLAHPDDRPMLRAVVRDPSLLTEAIILRWIHRDGHAVWIELRATPVDDPASGLVIEGIARDITEQKLAEEALRTALEQETRAADELRRVNQMKDTFLQAVSHEMRTPLTAIVGFTGLLQQRHAELSEERVNELLDRTAVNANRLHNLLADLLDLDRVTRSAAEAHRTPARIDRLVSEVVADVDFGERPVVLDVEPLTVEVDVPRVERIVDNLVTNAMRHTPAGSPVEIAVDAHPEGIVLRVDDRGEGVPEDLKPVLFEPFVQGDTPASRTGGAGVGLSIVARFAELHGGRAWVEDRPGGGASFRVLLPCEVARPPLLAEVSSPRPASARAALR